MDYKPALSSETWPFPPNQLHAGEKQTELKDFGTWRMTTAADYLTREKVYFPVWISSQFCSAFCAIWIDCLIHIHLSRLLLRLQNHFPCTTPAAGRMASPCGRQMGWQVCQYQASLPSTPPKLKRMLKNRRTYNTGCIQLDIGPNNQTSPLRHFSHPSCSLWQATPWCSFKQGQTNASD